MLVTTDICRDKRLVTTSILLSRQKTYLDNDKMILVAVRAMIVGLSHMGNRRRVTDQGDTGDALHPPTTHPTNICRDKHKKSVATKDVFCLSRQNVCRDKIMSHVFVATKMILAAAPLSLPPKGKHLCAKRVAIQRYARATRKSVLLRETRAH